MGLKSYFLPGAPAAPAGSTSPSQTTADGNAQPSRPSALEHAHHLRNPSKHLRAPSISGKSTRSLASSIFVEDIRHEVVVNYLYQNQMGKNWIVDGSGEVEGALVRRARNDYVACPDGLGDSPFASAIMTLNVPCAMTVNSRTIKTLLTWCPEAEKVPMLNGLQVQILPTIHDLPRARKHQYAAFIASEALLVVWDDDPMRIFDRACKIENEIMELIYGGSDDEDDDDADDSIAEKKKQHDVTEVEIDEESGQAKPEARPVHMINTYFVSVVLCLITVTLGAAWRQLAIATMVDQNYIRLCLVLLGPVQVFFTLFFAQVIVGCIAQCVGPIKQLKTNSKFYSAKPPPRLRSNILPHVTVQCPVYKEGLAGVILPTVRSLKKAISTYELQGGSANIFINDDGLQLLSEEERRDRIEFYADHSIGWVARPRHGEDGFLRRGKFKKASNMNFAMMISCNVEEKLAAVERNPEWSQNDEAEAYEQALKEVVQENGRAWADGNIRIGDYILIIDSDTRVPEDCLLDAVSEMEQSPDVGIMQFSSGVMQVVHTYFENGITFFTNLIYSAIRYTVANGDVAPFVGHNAILRWSAIQQVSYFDEDNYEKFWSESHVSEDFDMSLRLQCAGYIIRLAAWAGEGFKEGVSLTVYDELARWEKYAYGCNELLFHPIRTWLWRGPFTPLFRRFLFSNIRLTSKITVISYIGTYYAIGAAWLLTTVNYFAMGWFNGYLDKYYLDSWQVWFSIIIVFNGLGNIGLAAMRWRSGQGKLFACLIENFKWTLLFAIFLGGLSLHVSQALLAHMFEINMTWGATAKEAEFSNFFIEVPKVLKKFKWSMLFSCTFIAIMIIFAKAPFIPYDWRITDFVAILPMSTVVASHLLLPIALNPAIMVFSW
ncbi:glycosyl transferase family group 2-domain-containing protein [Microdochium trichocladiopsis]|uniref:Glycosyl transferase family group 2-domain-containing protein n=1 Tax=Microdochium trichocladiopsis TaxID=1682393 RepID=A0A9P8YD23_9PEZI|nr:glycosyl transferase family group 2-domain-containing protein [Microdochium trichocladiopsis]KAH7037098.1 glycosyl transferase family group 2-domain-containing protein [Microdochium trichocladiopsis]